MNRIEKYRLTDEEIIRLIIAKKDPKYFEVIYDRYAQKVYNKSLGFVKDRVKAEDITHDVFVKVFLKLSSFNFKANFSTWLYVVTYNHCIDYLNKERKERIAYESFSEEEAGSEMSGNEDDILAIQLDRLKVILDMIHPEERMILLLKYQDDLSIKEIEQVTGLSISAVKMRLKRSKEKVIKIYEDLYSHNVI